MAGNDGLFKALEMFKDGMKGLAVQSAINDANKKVWAARSQVQDENEQMMAVRNIADDLALQLHGLGAAKEAEGTRGILTESNPNINTPQQAILMGSQRQQKLGRELLQQQTDLLSGKIHAGREDKSLQMLNDRLKGFHKIGKTELDGLDTLNSLPDDPAENFLTYSTALKALIKRQDNRITEQDFELAVPNKDLRSRAKRVFDMLISNKPLPEDSEAILALTSALKEQTERRLQSKIKGYAKTHSKTLTGRTPEELTEMLSSMYMAGTPSANQNTTIQVPNLSGGGQQGPSEAPYKRFIIKKN